MIFKARLQDFQIFCGLHMKINTWFPAMSGIQNERLEKSTFLRHAPPRILLAIYLGQRHEYIIHAEPHSRYFRSPLNLPLQEPLNQRRAVPILQSSVQKSFILSNKQINLHLLPRHSLGTSPSHANKAPQPATPLPPPRPPPCAANPQAYYQSPLDLIPPHTRQYSSNSSTCQASLSQGDPTFPPPLLPCVRLASFLRR